MFYTVGLLSRKLEITVRGRVDEIDTVLGAHTIKY